MAQSNRVRETSSSIGTGDFALFGGEPSFTTIVSKYAVGVYFPYQITSDTQQETGLGYLSSDGTLVRAFPLKGSNGDRTHVDFVDGPKSVSEVGGDAISNAFWGNGAEGSYSPSSGTDQLSSNSHFVNLTPSGTFAIDANGWIVYIQNLLDLRSAPAGVIQNNGNNGSSASGGTGGAGTSASHTSAYTPLGTGFSSNTGANGTTGAGAQANAATTLQACAGGAGGDSFTAGAGTAGAGGGGRSGGNPGTALDGSMAHLPLANSLTTLAATVRGGGMGGGGGGSGSGDAATAVGGGGGGSGGGGGPILIYARYILANGCAANAISAVGGNGGNGANGGASALNTGGGSGGAGGGGGWILLVYEAILDAGASNVLVSSGGNGGNGGTGVNAGGNGAGAEGGDGGRIITWCLSTNTVTVLDPAASTAPSGTTGGVGGVNQADLLP